MTLDLKQNMLSLEVQYICRKMYLFERMHTKFIDISLKSDNSYIQGYRKRWTGFETAIT